MTHSLKYRLRRTILLTLRGVVYVLLLVALSQTITETWNLFQQFLLISILLVLSSYLSIDLQYVKAKRIWFSGLGLMCITTYRGFLKGVELGASQQLGFLGTIAPAWVMVLLHIGLLVLITQKIDILRNRRKVDSLSFLTPWISVFAISIAGMFALLTSLKMTVQKVDCNEFYDAVTDVVRFFGSPLFLGVDAKNKAEQIIENIRTSSVAELVGIDKLNIDDFTSLPSSFQGDNGHSIKWILNTIGNEKRSDIEDSNNSDDAEANAWWLFDLLQTFRERFVTEIISDKDMINKWLCTIIIDEVDNKLQKPGFRFSVAILLFFIFSPIINFIFLVVIGIGFVVFQILKFFGVRHTEKVLTEIEVMK